MVRATTRLRYHFLLAGTTYHGACSVEHPLMASSKARWQSSQKARSFGVLVTLVTGVLLFVPPAQVPLWAVLLGLLLFAVIAVSTALFQAPKHGILSAGFDRGAYEFLLRTNWIRTAAWSVYALLGLWMVWQTTP